MQVPNTDIDINRPANRAIRSQGLDKAAIDPGCRWQRSEAEREKLPPAELSHVR